MSGFDRRSALKLAATLLACAAVAASNGAAVALAKAIPAPGEGQARLSGSSVLTPTRTDGGPPGAASHLNPAELMKSGNQVPPAVPPSANTSVNGPVSANGAYTALSPTRLLDTRLTHQTLGARGRLNLVVTGGSVPANATAVTLNVTVTDTTSASFLTVYPAGESTPLLSNLNWPSGDTVPNLVIVPVGSGGAVTFYNDAGAVDVVVDLEGYFAPETTGSTTGSYIPLPPARITDTRPGSGYPDANGPLGPGGRLDVQVTGEGGVPSTGVTAALMNVTVTDTSAPSFLTIYPQGKVQPLASNLNWSQGMTIPNRVVVPVGPTGMITLFNDAGLVDVVIDVNGYFTNGAAIPPGASLFSPISPERVLDTRTTGQTLGTASTLTQQLSGVVGIATNASAVVTNVTVTDTSAPSFLTVFPGGGTQQLTSDLNWYAGDTVPNLTVATLGGTGAISMYNDQGSLDVVVDAFGYFVPESPTPVVIITPSLPSGTVGTTFQTTTLNAYGGTPTYSWGVTSGSLPPGLSLSSGGVISGTPTAASTFDFTVQVTDSTTPTPETATQALSLTVYLATALLDSSGNWSGYSIQSGPYTYVSGTFNVPNLYAAPTETDFVQWVGIDGAYNSDLIQAGTAETYDPSTNLVYLAAWWEILPAPETMISGMSVLPGDTMTVTIGLVSGSEWAIEVANDTTGQTFVTDQTYYGPGASSEWIVEAPMQGGAITTLGDYTPDVTFSNLSLAGAQNTLTYWYMVQNGVQVSTPSTQLTASGFAVAYGDVAPSPP